MLRLRCADLLSKKYQCAILIEWDGSDYPRELLKWQLPAFLLGEGLPHHFWQSFWIDSSFTHDNWLNGVLPPPSALSVGSLLTFHTLCIDPSSNVMTRVSSTAMYDMPVAGDAAAPPKEFRWPTRRILRRPFHRTTASEVWVGAQK